MSAASVRCAPPTTWTARSGAACCRRVGVGHQKMVSLLLRLQLLASRGRFATRTNNIPWESDRLSIRQHTKPATLRVAGFVLLHVRPRRKRLFGEVRRPRSYICPS